MTWESKFGSHFDPGKYYFSTILRTKTLIFWKPLMKSFRNCLCIILTMILFCIPLYLTLSFGVPRMALKEKYQQDLILSSNHLYNICPNILRQCWWWGWAYFHFKIFDFVESRFKKNYFRILLGKFDKLLFFLYKVERTILELAYKELIKISTCFGKLGNRVLTISCFSKFNFIGFTKIVFVMIRCY